MDHANLNISEYKPKTDVLSQYMYFSKNNDDLRQDDSLNYPFSNKKKKINDDNSILNGDDDKVMEEFEDDDE